VKWLLGKMALGEMAINRLALFKKLLESGILWSWAKRPDYSTVDLHTVTLHWVIRYDRDSNLGSFDPGPNVLTTRPWINTQSRYTGWSGMTRTRIWDPFIPGQTSWLLDRGSAHSHATLGDQVWPGLESGILWSRAKRPDNSTVDQHTVTLHWVIRYDRDSNLGSFDPGPNVLTTRPWISTQSRYTGWSGMTRTRIWDHLIPGQVSWLLDRGSPHGHATLGDQVWPGLESGILWSRAKCPDYSTVDLHWWSNEWSNVKADSAWIIFPISDLDTWNVDEQIIKAKSRKSIKCCRWQTEIKSSVFQSLCNLEGLLSVDQ
jgi:hypothetical protein